jgi:hypothetical protein
MIAMVTQPPMERLNRLIEEGYSAFSPQHPFEACDRWIEGWALLESGPVNGARSTAELERKFRFKEPIRDWLTHLEQALGFAGDRRPEYHEHRVRYCRAVRARFPDEDSTWILWFHAVEADSLMKLERDDEADTALTSGIERFPDNPCGYIGWADRHVYRSRTGQPDFQKAEAILKEALARPTIENGGLALLRLTEVYRLWGEDRPVHRPRDGEETETDHLLQEMGLTRIECDDPTHFIAVSTDALSSPTPFALPAPRLRKSSRKLARWLRNGKGRR